MEDESPERIELKDFPWKTLATNAALVGGTHMAGYMLAGALAKKMAPVMKKNLSPEAIQRVSGRMATLASMGAMLTLQAQQEASFRRIEKSLQEENERKGRTRHGSKVASVHSAYALALRGT